MRITIRIDDALHAEARAEAARSGITLRAFIERALRESLPKGSSAAGPRIELPVFRGSGGLRPGVDLDNSAALLDLMEGVPN